MLANGPRSRASYPTLTESSIACLARRNAAAEGLQVLAVRFLHPEGIPVPVITAQAPTALIRRSGGQTGLAAGLLSYQHRPYSPYLGFLVEIRDPQARWVQSVGSVPDTGSGTGAFAPGYAQAQACDGLLSCTTHG